MRLTDLSIEDRRKVIIGISVVVCLVLSACFVIGFHFWRSSKKGTSVIQQVLPLKPEELTQFDPTITESFTGVESFKASIDSAFEEAKKKLALHASGENQVIDETLINPSYELESHKITIKFNPEMFSSAKFGDFFVTSKARAFASKDLFSPDLVVNGGSVKAVDHPPMDKYLGKLPTNERMKGLGKYYSEGLPYVLDLLSLNQWFAYISIPENQGSIEQAALARVGEVQEEHLMVLAERQFKSRTSVASLLHLQKDLLLDLWKIIEKYSAALGCILRQAACRELGKTPDALGLLPNLQLRLPVDDREESSWAMDGLPSPMIKLVKPGTPIPGRFMVAYDGSHDQGSMTFTPGKPVSILTSPVFHPIESHVVKAKPSKLAGPDLKLRGKRALNRIVKSQLLFAIKYDLPDIIVNLDAAMLDTVNPDHYIKAYRQLSVATGLQSITIITDVVEPPKIEKD